MKIRIPLLKHKYSIYSQKRSWGKCPYCGKDKICYQIRTIESPKDTYGVPAWTCVGCMPNDMAEYYFC